MEPLIKRQKDKNTLREFFLSEEFPPENLVCVTIWIVQYKDNFIFTENHRGIEMPGWHIEPWESIQEGLKREIAEETWAIIKEKYKLIWHTKVHNKTKKKRKDWKWYYPSPHAYVAYFLTKAETLREPHGEETIARHIIHKDEIHTVQLHDTAQKILKAVIEKYT
jgi:ADP-ribose pyrophosphatase YjhB (NUDIX family)